MNTKNIAEVVTAQADNLSEKCAAAYLREIAQVARTIQREGDMTNPTASEKGMERAQEMALSVEVRSGWAELMNAEKLTPAEFKILLAWGGPAIRIIGELNEHGEVIGDSCRIQHQDWGTPWQTLNLGQHGQDALAIFCQSFPFGYWA